MTTSKLNLMTIDKLLSLLKNKTASWAGMIEIKDQYLLADAKVQTIQQNDKEGNPITMDMATISFTAGNQPGSIGTNGTQTLTYPLQGVTAGSLTVMAQYVLKAVKHVSDILSKDVEDRTKK